VCACCGAGAPRQCLRVFLSISECFTAYWTVCSPCDGYGACQVLKRFPPCADANGEQAAIHAPAQQAAARGRIAAIGQCHREQCLTTQASDREAACRNQGWGTLTHTSGEHALRVVGHGGADFEVLPMCFLPFHCQKSAISCLSRVVGPRRGGSGQCGVRQPRAHTR
jgi:hypothetical protein